MRRFGIMLMLLTACDDAPDPTVEALEDRVAHLEDRLAALQARLDATAESTAPPLPTFAMPDAPPATDERPAPARLSVVVKATGVVEGDRTLTDTEFAERLRAVAAQHRDPAVTLRSEPDVPHARVVDIMDRVRKAGIARIAVATLSDDTD
ncbi:MAG: biopolymer transporter ExbD [Myxococcota bacterium]